MASKEIKLVNRVDMPLVMGLSIDTDPKSVQARAIDQRGYIDSDIPVLESFGILKNGTSPEALNMSPDDYKTFIDWLQNGPARPVPSGVPMRVLCFYREKLKKSIDDFSTTEGDRLKQQNLLKMVDEMLRDGDDDTDPVQMCASGGQSPAPAATSDCCDTLSARFQQTETLISSLSIAEPLKALEANMDAKYAEAGSFLNKLSGPMQALQTTLTSLSSGLLAGIATDVKTSLEEIAATKAAVEELKVMCAGKAPAPAPAPAPLPPTPDIIARLEEARRKLAEAETRAAAAKAELARIVADENSTSEQIDVATDAADQAISEVERLRTEASELYIQADYNSSSSSANTGVAQPPVVIGGPSAPPENNSAQFGSGMVGGRQPLPKQNADLLKGVDRAVNDLKKNVAAARRRANANRRTKDKQRMTDVDAKLQQLLVAYQELARKIGTGQISPELLRVAQALEAKVAAMNNLLNQHLASDAEVATLRTKLSTAEGALRNSADRVRQLQVQLIALRNILANLKLEPPAGDQSGLNQMYKSALAEIDRLSAEVQRLETKQGDVSADAERDSGIVQEKLRSAEAKVAELTQKLMKMTEQWTAANAKARFLDKKVTNAADAIVEANGELRRLRELLVVLSGMLAQIRPFRKIDADNYDRLNTMYEGSVKQIEMLAANIQRLETEKGDSNADKEREKNQLVEELDKAKANVTELAQKLTKMTEQYTAADAEARYLGKKATNSAIAMMDANEQIKRLRAQMQVLSDTLARVRPLTQDDLDNYDNLNTQYKAALKQIDKLADDIQKLETEKGDTAANVEREKERLQGELEDAKANVADLTQRLQKMTEKYVASNADARFLGHQVVEAAAALQEANGEINVLRNQMNNLNAMLRQIRPFRQMDAENYDRLNDMYTAALEEITKLNAEIQRLETQGGDMTADTEQKLSTMRNELRDSKQRVNELTADLRVMTEKWSAAEERATQLQNQLEDSRLEFAAKNDEVKEKTRALAAETEHVAELEHTIEDLTAELEASQTELGKKTSLATGSSEEVARLEYEVDDLRAELANKTSELNTKTRSFTEASTELGRLQHEIEDKQAEITANQNELAQLRGSLADRTADAGRAEQMLELQTLEYDTYKEDAERLLAESRAALQNSQNMVEDKEGVIAGLKARFAAGVARLTQAKQEFDHERTLRLDAEKEVMDVKEQVAGVTAQLEALQEVKSETDAELERVRAELAECEARPVPVPDETLIQRLRAEIVRIQEESRAQQERIAVLTGEKTKAEARSLELEQAHQELSTWGDGIQAQLEESQTNVLTVMGRLAEKTAELEAAQVKIVALQQEATDASEQYKAALLAATEKTNGAIATARTLTEEREAAMQTIDSMRKQIEKMNGASGTAGELQQKLDLANAELSRKSHQLEIELNKIAAMNGEFQRTKSLYEERMNRTDQASRELDSTNKNLEKRYQDALIRIGDLERVLRDKERQTQMVEEENKSTIRNILGELNQLRQAAEQLRRNKERIAELEAHLAGLQANYADLMQGYHEVDDAYNQLLKQQEQQPVSPKEKRVSVTDRCGYCEATGDRGACAECDHIRRQQVGKATYKPQHLRGGRTRKGGRRTKGAKLRNFSRKIAPLK